MPLNIQAGFGVPAKRRAFCCGRALTLALILLFSAFSLYSCGKDETISGPFDPETYFNEANKLIEKKKYTEARKLLFDIKKKDTQMEFAPLAQLRLADTYVLDDEPDIGVEEYERFLKDYPRHKYSTYAQYQIGKVYYDLVTDADRGNAAIKKALEAFRTLNREYPRNPYREEAELMARHCLELLAEYEFIVGEFYFKKGAYKGALERFMGLLMQYPDYRESAKVFGRVALSYRMLYDEQNARKYLGILLERYPDSVAAKDTREELSKPPPEPPAPTDPQGTDDPANTPAPSTGEQG